MANKKSKSKNAADVKKTPVEAKETAAVEEKAVESEKTEAKKVSDSSKKKSAAKKAKTEVQEAAVVEETPVEAKEPVAAQAAPVEVKKDVKKHRKTVQYDRWGYFFIAPFFVIYIIFSLIPLLSTFIYSFFEYYRVGIVEVGPTFIGIKNYIQIFTASDNLAKYFLNTLIMWIIGFVPQIIVSLVLAVWFTNTELRLKFQQFFKTVIYMPNLIMAAAFSMLFFNLLSPNGPINNIIKSWVDRASIPDIARMITNTISQLKNFVTNHPGDKSVADSVTMVVNYLSGITVPKGLSLLDTTKFLSGISDQAIQVFNSSYAGAHDGTYLNLASTITSGLYSAAKPMNSIRFFTYTGWTRSIVALMNFLMWYGNTTILLMAGVMGIDNSLFEAARIDGASPLKIFFKITIPLLLPIFVYVLITSLIGGIQMFDVPQILTNGAGNPNRTVMTIIMKLNKHLQNKNYGPAGATSVLIFIVTAILSSIVYKTTMQQYQNKR